MRNFFSNRQFRFPIEIKRLSIAPCLGADCPEASIRGLPSLRPGLVDLYKRSPQIFRDIPTRIVRFHSRKIGDVTNVIPFPILIDVLIRHLDPGNFFNKSESLKDRNGIVASAADVIDRPKTRALNELMHELGNVIGMNVIPHLLPAVPENPISSPLQIASNQVAEKPVEFDPGVIRPGQTSTAKAAGWHLKITAVLLN